MDAIIAGKSCGKIDPLRQTPCDSVNAALSTATSLPPARQAPNHHAEERGAALMPGSADVR
ncbi:MAG TPA: hypothetical protein VKY65_07000 [Alphaproteobacteria bacterium]|nr:hypothetical protein [Alphaproteobacteria bacterium]